MYELKKLEKTDIEKCRNEIVLKKNFDFPFIFTNQQDVTELLDPVVKDYRNMVRFVIEDDKKEVLALTGLLSIDYINQSAILCTVLKDVINQGHNLETFTLEKMLNHAFYVINLHRVEVYVLEENVQVIKWFENNGFVYEGKKRKAYYRNETFVDLLMYSLLKSEYKKKECKDETLKMIPFWNIGFAVTRNEIDYIIRSCSKSVSQADNYSNRLDKICLKGNVVFAYNQEYMGYCAFYANDAVSREAYITSISVQEKYQGMHVGKNLLEACFKIAEGKGMKTCVLEVQKDNESAIKFYRKNKFELLRERDGSFFLIKKL